VLKVCTGREPDPISILCVCVVLQRCCAFYRSLFPTCSHFLSTAFFGSALQMREISDRPHSSFGVCGLFLWQTSTYLSNGSDDFRKKCGLAIHLKMLLSYSPTPNIILSQESIHPTVYRRKNFKRQWLQSTRVTQSLIFIKSLKTGTVDGEQSVCIWQMMCTRESMCIEICFLFPLLIQLRSTQENKLRKEVWEAEREENGTREGLGKPLLNGG